MEFAITKASFDDGCWAPHLFCRRFVIDISGTRALLEVMVQMGGAMAIVFRVCCINKTCASDLYVSGAHGSTQNFVLINQVYTVELHASSGTTHCRRPILQTSSFSLFICLFCRCQSHHLFYLIFIFYAIQYLFFFIYFFNFCRRLQNINPTNSHEN